MKAGGDEYCITIQKKDLSAVLNRIAAQLSLLKPKELKLLYPLKLEGGGEKIITLRYNKIATVFQESLEQFYIQAVPFSTIAVEIENVKNTRVERPHEISFDDYFVKYPTADKKFYMDMITPYVAEAFLRKTKYVRVLFGTNWCVNLISPGHFLCHVQGCGNLIKLKDFNDLTLVTSHFKDHVHATNTKTKRTKFSDDKSCVVLLRRHKLLKSQKYLVYSREVDKSINELEPRKNKEGLPYAIIPLMQNKVLVKEGEIFKGHIYHTKLDIMEKISNHDPTALDGVAEAPTIGSMFGRRKR